MPLRTLALLLVVLGVLCLPAPLYLSWAAESSAPPPRTSQVYTAQPVDPGDGSDRGAIVRHAGAVALSTHQVSERYSAGEYRSPNVTRRSLETAMATGSATTNDSGASSDLRRIGHNYTFVYDAYSERHQYYELRLRDDGSRVVAHPVARAEVVNVTVERATVRYESLSPPSQRTFDRILANSTGGDERGYRPRLDRQITDRLPGLVRRNGTLYSVEVAAHVDDFGPGFAAGVVGPLVTVAGALLVLVGSFTYFSTLERG